MFYEIRVELQDIEPTIWRTLRVPLGTNLLKLHRILQRAMGWKDSHQHAFQMEARPPKRLSPETMTLEKVFAKGRKSFLYEYDFGDGWLHEITLLGLVEGEGKVTCTDGARACPPENCGGPPGYYNLLVALSDSDHEDHDDMLEWVGGKYDPSAFDVAAVNRALKRLR